MNAVRVVLVAISAVLLCGCDLAKLIFGTAPPPPATTIGHFSAFAETSYYQCSEALLSGLPTPTAAAAEFQTQMQLQEQLQSAYVPDNVNAQQLVASESNSDWIWYSGHGDPGLFELYYCETSGHNPNVTSWGPGSTSQEYQSNATGFPVQGLLKWIFAYSSDTVAVPPITLPSSPDYTADWSRAFGSKLHGLYGFYQVPGTCLPGSVGFTGGGVTCDIDSAYGPGMADSLVAHTITDNPQETVHLSWVHAADDQGFGDRWSMWENSESITDLLSGEGNGNSPPDGMLLFYAAANENATVVGPAALPNASTFQLYPTALNAEALSDSSLLTAAQPYFGAPDTYVSNGTFSLATKGATTVQHYLLSGAVSFHGLETTNAVAFTEATAQAAALQAAQSINGMPSDAVLTETARQWKVDPSSGGRTLTGFLFTWKHQDSVASHDAIRVSVTDYQNVTQTCTGGFQVVIGPAGRPISVCEGWTTTYTDQPNISYMFRMWHTTGSVRHVLSLGQTSITAATAATSLPPGATIVSYATGNWSPRFDDPSPNIATPAWVFTLAGGVQVYIDAYTGQVLGSIAD